MPSSLDSSLEPSLLYFPKGAKTLVVGLHTWSADRFNQMESMLPHCEERRWALLLPEFRGPNLKTNSRASQACGSSLARRDIVDATQWVLKTYFTSHPATFLLGGSGGGHMALLVAAREDYAWTAVSSWCPITDLSAWHRENSSYAQHIESVCGGPPDLNEEVSLHYYERSPLNFADGLRQVRLQLAHGKHDSSVSYTHSWNLIEQLSDADTFYFSVFNGKHELLYPQAFAFFDETISTIPKDRLTG